MESLESKRISELEARLAHLEDERAIRDILDRYCHALDYSLAEQWADLFADDAVCRLPAPSAPLEGRDALIRFIRERSQRETAPSKHCLMNPVITFDGEKATAESYLAVFALSAAGETYVRVFGRYHDRLVKGMDGKWRFTERIVDPDVRIER